MCEEDIKFDAYIARETPLVEARRGNFFLLSFFFSLLVGLSAGYN